jgi:hypothetical protein
LGYESYHNIFRDFVHRIPLLFGKPSDPAEAIKAEKQLQVSKFCSDSPWLFGTGVFLWVDTCPNGMWK